MADGTSKDEGQSIDNAIVPYDKLKSIGSEEEKTFEQLQTYICTYRPLIYINHYDFATIDSMVMKVAEKGFEGGGIVEYVEGYGRVDFATKKDLNKGESLAKLLESYVQQDDLEGNWILLLKNVHKELEETKIQSLIRQIAGRSMGEYGRCHTGYLVYVIIVSPIKVIPPLLERLMCVVSLGSPDETEILEYLKSDSGRQGASENDLKEMSSMLRGFSRLEIDKILYTMDQGGMAFNSDEAQKTILQEKRQQVEKLGLLRIAKVNENDITVGGLGVLTKYLEHESKILSDAVRAKEFGVEMPKGILIVGVPGCGKTMLSKFTAYKFRMPLICLEIGNLMGPYVG